ncbi:hypothetical protein MIMGU_mgv1a009963mg [Erythranthe guttata]|uniref:Uncharacterized protein n=1 Tax=Erythranthe guttata TaxID=4155 RepID=A0A022RWK4_ERYGU|nr:hypothetical protein MIMGU_mgv1a009963mg [Erythranthe guttata]
MSSKFCPLTSISAWPVKNLSGLNSSGSGHSFSSRWIFQIFTIKRVPARTLYPGEIVQSSIAEWRPITGAGGYNLSVSLTTACRYTRFFKSDSSTCLFFGMQVSISSRAFFNTSGLFRRSDRTHPLSDEDIEFFCYSLHGFLMPLQVEPPENRYRIRQNKHTEEPKEIGHQFLLASCLFVLTIRASPNESLPTDHPNRCIKRKVTKPLLHIDFKALFGIYAQLINLLQRSFHLGSSYVTQHADPTVGEKLEGDDLPHLAPVGPVWREPEHGEVVGQQLRGGCCGPVREGLVMGGEALLRHLPAAHDQSFLGPEFNGKGRPVFVGHGC